ncbi:MAG: hypothetical protein GY871_04270 [Actinomycetales bacterium]|nr:hypothetical protein [Actinomycetales bacterium]
MAWIWDRLCAGVKAFDELANAGVWYEWAKEDFRDDEEEVDAALGLLGQLANRPPADMSPMASLDVIVRFNQTSAIRVGGIPMLQALERNDLAEATRLLNETAEFVNKAAAAGDDPLRSMMDDLDADLDAYGEEGAAAIWKLPLPTLNRLTGGGIPSGQLIVVMGSTNSGKSAFLADIAWTAAESNPDTIVVACPVEETVKEYKARLYCRAGQIDRQRLRAGGLSPLERGALKTKCATHKDILERILVKKVSGSVGTAIAAAREKRREFPGRPIMLVVDSPDDLAPDAKKESYRLERARVMTQLDVLAKEEDMQPISVAITTQANRAAAGKARVGAQNTSETKVTADKAALGLALLDSQGGGSEEDLWKPTRVQIWKNRLGSVNNVVIRAEGHFGFCEFREASEEL